jgi:hypothetical protein
MFVVVTKYLTKYNYMLILKGIASVACRGSGAQVPQLAGATLGTHDVLKVVDENI